MSQKLCLGCFKPLRPIRTLLKDYPGTVTENCRGVCKTCYKNGNIPHGNHTPASVEATRASLDRYLKARRPYRQKLGTS